MNENYPYHFDLFVSEFIYHHLKTCIISGLPIDTMPPQMCNLITDDSGFLYVDDDLVFLENVKEPFWDIYAKERVSEINGVGYVLYFVHTNKETNERRLVIHYDLKNPSILQGRIPSDIETHAISIPFKKDEETGLPVLDLSSPDFKEPITYFLEDFHKSDWIGEITIH